MNAAEKKALTKLFHYAAACGWVPVRFWDGEAYQRGASPEGMTLPELIGAVESVDDGLIMWRNARQRAADPAQKDNSLRTIPDNCRDGLELFNDWSEVHGFGQMMADFVIAWESGAWAKVA